MSDVRELRPGAGRGSGDDGRPPEPPREQVTFARKHRHGGVDYEKGETAQVSARAREKLAKRQPPVIA